MPEAPQGTSYQDRLVALKLLRENMFYSDPKRYAYTDIAEDLPGSARAVAPILKNVLPTAAIISKDPEERDKQIDAAIERIKASKKSKSKLLGEMWHNVTHLVPESAKAGLTFGLASALLGIRSPFKENSWKLQSPVAPIQAIKKLISTKAHALPNAGGYGKNQLPGANQWWLAKARHKAHLKNTVKDVANNALASGVLTGAAGVAVPMLAGNYELSDDALQEAKQVMQKDPYITSLPAAEMLSAIRQRKSETPLTNTQRIKNTLLGTGLGALTALPTAIIPAVLSGAGKFSANALGRLASKIPNVGSARINSFLKANANTNPLMNGVGSTIRSHIKKDVPMATAWGAGFGGLAGALSSNNPLVDEYENLGPH